MTITWSPLAIERVIEYSEYIALDSPSASTKWVDEIFKKVEILQVSPEIGRNVAEVKDKKFRELIFGNYRIIYHLDKINISVLTVRLHRQILPVAELKV
jgi:plasmid stabilization system protein ParE